MYPSSSSSSSSSHGGSMPTSGGGGLTRYGSAPGSFLTTAVDSVIGPNVLGAQVGPSRFFPSESTSDSTFKPIATRPSADPRAAERKGGNTSSGNIHGIINTAAAAGSQRSTYSVNEFATAFSDLKSGNGGAGGGSSPSLARHRSSPADFLEALTDKGFSVPRGTGSYSSKGSSDTACGMSKLNSQLSFTRQESLSQIAEESENVINGIGADGRRKASHSYTTASFGMGSWDDSNSITFPSSKKKRAKNISTDIGSGLNIVESQFGPSQSALEMAAMESLMDIPQDSVPCKIRAKRGCATHPRSIAERERRTRISGKLKKLQDLVPNMDKQTSYADMLDLAVQHIKGLQTEVQNLNHELENCSCGCKKAT